ncbi:MAG: hypothetical protein M5U22_14390 [Thermoleophilia bacterium]|nr:hypothetical protein [Thermoleophilia bacterium]
MAGTLAPGQCDQDGSLGPGALWGSATDIMMDSAFRGSDSEPRAEGVGPPARNASGTAAASAIRKVGRRLLR